MTKPKFDSRLSLKLTPGMREKLDEITVRVGAQSVSEVVRDALRVYDIITNDVHNRGRQILSRAGKDGEVLRVHFWPESAAA